MSLAIQLRRKGDEEDEYILCYTADFYIPEIQMVIEADGIYGHLKKRDVKRDADIMRIYGVENILHIKETPCRYNEKRSSQRKAHH